MKYVIVITFVFLIQVADAQKNDHAGEAILRESCKHQYLSLTPKGKKDKEKNAFPFRSIEVADYRPDSSRIGLFALRGQQYDLLFNAPVATSISNFLNEDCTNPSAIKSLYVVVKRLWLSDVTVSDQSGEISTSNKSTISFRAETYIKDPTGYMPLAYFDTVITAEKAIMEIAPFRLPALLSSFMEKINSIDINSTAIRARRVLSDALVDSFSNRTFQYPVQVSDSLHKGVYASFEEFKNNKPSVFDYEIKQEENSIMSLHLKDEQGNSYYSRKMWGFCDGQQSYAMIEGNLFPVFTYGRAYYILGSKEYVVRKTSAILFFIMPVFTALGAFPTNAKEYRKMRFFWLDMDTGNVY